MRFLALTTLRARWLAFTGLFLTMVTASALITACGTLLETGIRGDVPPERLRGADLVVASRQTVTQQDGDYTIHADVAERVRVDLAVADAVRAVAGVALATPDLSFSAYIIGSDHQPVTGPFGRVSLGHGWSSAAITPFALVAGRPPSAADEIVLDTELLARAAMTIGDTTRLVVRGRAIHATVVGAAAPTGLALAQQSAVFFDDEAATVLYGHAGEADAIAVRLSDGADRSQVVKAIRAVVGRDSAVLIGDGRGRAEFVETLGANLILIAISATLGGISLFVAVFVAAGMLALLIQQRQRELALLRAVAATPRQVRRMIRTEMLTVGLLGALAGLRPGTALGAHVITMMKTKGVLPDAFDGDTGPIAPIAAIAVVAILAIVAGSVASRRAGKVRPVEALSAATLQPRTLGRTRAAVGAVALLMTTGLFVVSMTVRPANVPAFGPALVSSALIATAMFAPPLAAALLRLVTGIARVSPIGGYLAVAHTKAYSRRLAAAVLPMILVVSVVGMTNFQQTTIKRESQQQSRERVVADHVITAGPAGLPLDAIARLAGEPGVQTAIGFVPTKIYPVFAGGDLEPYNAYGVTAGPLERVLDLGYEHAPTAELSPTEVALSAELATEFGALQGDTIMLRLGDGTLVERTVAAVFSRALGFGDAILPAVSIEDHVTELVMATVMIRTDPTRPVSPSIWTAFEADHPGARVGGRELVLDADEARSNIQASFNYVLLGMVVAFSVIALINTLVLSVSDRVREFAQLRLVGVTRRQIKQMMRWEALIITTIGCILGGAIAFLTLMPFSKAVTGSVMPHAPWTQCVALTLAALTAAVIGNAIPTHVALRSRPIDAIGVRD